MERGKERRKEGRKEGGREGEGESWPNAPWSPKVLPTHTSWCLSLVEGRAVLPERYQVWPGLSHSDGHASKT